MVPHKIWRYFLMQTVRVSCLCSLLHWKNLHGNSWANSCYGNSKMTLRLSLSVSQTKITDFTWIPVTNNKTQRTRGCRMRLFTILLQLLSSSFETATILAKPVLVATMLTCSHEAHVDKVWCFLCLMSTKKHQLTKIISCWSQANIKKKCKQRMFYRGSAIKN